MIERVTGDVFIVDDNPDALALLAGVLRERGHRVRMAESGRRALSMIASHLPDLVMLDVFMPEMDGWEVCRRLKADPAMRDVPVIFISALDSTLDKVKALRSGAVDYIAKPFHVEEVVARVEKQLGLFLQHKETRAKTAELERAYEELRRSQEQIAAMVERPSGALENTPAWAVGKASEVARTIGASRIGVFFLEGDRLSPLDSAATVLPDAGELAGRVQRGEYAAGDGVTVFPAAGLTGEVRGALVVEVPHAAFDEGKRRLVRAFAHHLGTALEIRRYREQLTAAETRRAESRRELRARGIETVAICPTCWRCFPQRDEGPPVCPDDGAALDATRLLPLVVQSRYRLERLLGEGGMGTVFSGHDEKLGRAVALKIIKAEHLHQPAMRFRLEREARAIARIQHPGVIALYDSGEVEDGSAFLVMELLSGCDLASLMESAGPGTPGQVASLLRQTGSALVAAHRSGVIHRDVKPGNLFLVPAERDAFQVKVLDFGLARTARIDTRVTVSGIVAGTPAYMPPEQLRGEESDDRSDLYSLAAVAFEALSGRHAVTASTQLGTAAVEVLTLVPPPLSSVVPGIPEPLDAAFAAALSKKPADRPPSLEAWVDEVARGLAAMRVPPEWPGWRCSALQAAPRGGRRRSPVTTHPWLPPSVWRP